MSTPFDPSKYREITLKSGRKMRVKKKPSYGQKWTRTDTDAQGNTTTSSGGFTNYYNQQSGKGPVIKRETYGDSTTNSNNSNLVNKYKQGNTAMTSIAAPMSFEQYKKNAPKQGGYMGKYERTGNIEQDYKNYTNQAGFDLYKGMQGDQSAYDRYDKRNPGTRERMANWHRQNSGRPTSSSGQGVNMSTYRQTNQSSQNQGSGNAQYSAYSPKQTQQTSRQPQYSSLSMAPGSTPQQVQEANRNWQNWMNQTKTQGGGGAYKPGGRYDPTQPQYRGDLTEGLPENKGDWTNQDLDTYSQRAAQSGISHLASYYRGEDGNIYKSGKGGHIPGPERMIPKSQQSKKSPYSYEDLAYRNRLLEEMRNQMATESHDAILRHRADTQRARDVYRASQEGQAQQVPQRPQTDVSRVPPQGGTPYRPTKPEDQVTSNVRQHYVPKDKGHDIPPGATDIVKIEHGSGDEELRYTDERGQQHRVFLAAKPGSKMPPMASGNDMQRARQAFTPGGQPLSEPGESNYGDPTGDIRGRMLELARQQGGSFGGDGAGYKLTVPPQGGTSRAGSPQASSSLAGPLHHELRGMSERERENHSRMSAIAHWAAGKTNPAVQQNPKQRRLHEEKARELFGSTSGPSAKTIQEALDYGNKMNKIAQENILGSRALSSVYNVGEADDISGTSFMRQNMLDSLQSLLPNMTDQERDKAAGRQSIGGYNPDGSYRSDAVTFTHPPSGGGQGMTPYQQHLAAGGDPGRIDTSYPSGGGQDMTPYQQHLAAGGDPGLVDETYPKNTGAGSRKNPYGFTPPAPGMNVTMALVPYHNPTTGETWTAPSGGWQAPKGWKRGNPPSNQTSTQNAQLGSGGVQDLDLLAELTPMSKTDITEMNNSLADFAGNLDAAPSGDDFPGLEEVTSQYAPVASTSTAVSRPSVTTQSSSTGGVRTTTMPGIVPTSSSYIPGTSMSQPSSSMVMTAPVVSQDGSSFDNYAENMEAYQQGNEMGQYLASGRPAPQPNARLGNIGSQNQNYYDSDFINPGYSRRYPPQAPQGMQQSAEVSPITKTAPQAMPQSAPAPAPQPQFAEDVTQFAAPGSIDVDAIAAAYSPGTTVGETTGMDEYLAKTAAFEQQMANSQPQMNFGMLGGGTGTFSDAMAQRDAFINRINEARRPAFANPGSGAGRNLDFGALLEQAGEDVQGGFQNPFAYQNFGRGPGYR